MIGANGLRGAGMATAFARQRIASTPRSARLMSTFRTQRVRIPSHGSQLASGTLKNVSRGAPFAIAGPAAIRFNSTTPTPASTPEPASGELPNIDELSSIDISKIPEHIGYLKELGLDFGWGFTATLQWMLEHIHLWTGMPWWASIVSLGLLTRLVLLKPALDASHTAAQTNNLKPIINPIKQKYMRAASEGNQMAVMEGRAELKRINQEHGIKQWKAFLPMLQIPLGFGVFRLTRGMTTLPVPALLNEQMGWIHDLTIADPFFILPAISAFCLYRTLKKGGETGMSELFSGSMGKTILIAFPSISFTFMAFMPAALQLYFVSTGMWGVAQAHFMNNHSVRRFLNMEIQKTTVATKEADDSLARLMRQLQEDRQQRLSKTTEQFKETVDPKHMSIIDRWMKQGKDHMEEVKANAQEKWKETKGASSTNADGSPAAEPRLTEAQRKAALKQEEAQSAYEAEERERRNAERRQAFYESKQQKGSGRS